MGTPAQVRAAIKTKIESVANVGFVYDYERYTDNSGKIKELFYHGTEKRVLAWMIRRTSFQRREFFTGEVMRLDRWVITGFMGVDDADESGNLFDALVESISQAFVADPTLGGVVDHIGDTQNRSAAYGLSADAIDPVMFAGILCHRATCSLITDSTESL